MGCCSEAPVLVVPMPPRLQHYHQTATRTAGWEGDQQVEQTFGRMMPTGIRTTMDIKCGCPCHAHSSVENSRGPGLRRLRVSPHREPGYRSTTKTSRWLLWSTGLGTALDCQWTAAARGRPAKSADWR